MDSVVAGGQAIGADVGEVQQQQQQRQERLTLERICPCLVAVG